MKKTRLWLLALAGVVGLSGTTYAGAPGVTALLIPQLFGQDSAPASQAAPRPAVDAYSLNTAEYAVRPFRTVAAAPPAAQDVEPRVEDVLVGVKDTHSGSFASAPAPVTQDAPRTVRAIVIAPMEEEDDGDDLCDLVWEGVSYCRMLFAPTRYQELGVVLEVMARLATEKYLESAATAVPPAGKTCEMLPYPKVVSGPGACPAANACGGCSGSIAISAWSCPRSAASCCPRAQGPCSEALFLGAADACDGPISATTTADKSCKCCEGCADGKDCQCGKKKTVRGDAGCMPMQVFMDLARPCPSMPMFPAAPCFRPMPGMTLSPIDLEVLAHPPMVPFAHPPLPGSLGEEVPLPLLMEHLKEMIDEREMISCAIHDIEQRLAALALRHHVAQAQAVAAAPATQKAHLVTEHFEAHCNALSCIHGDPSCILLEGDVRLTCKKNGTLRIEASRVLVNLEDGTFKVASVPGSVSCPTEVLEARTVTVVPMPTMKTWTVPGYPMPLPVHRAPVMPASQECAPAPYRSMPARCPAVPQSRVPGPGDADQDDK